jgi:hypothetical protein
MPRPRRPDPVKHCRVCGILLERRAKESHLEFAERQWCSRGCSGRAHRYQDPPKEKATVPDDAQDEETVMPNRKRRPPPWRSDPAPTALPTASGTLWIEECTGQRPKLVVVIHCRCGFRHVFPWPATSGITGTGGLRELCPLRGKRLIVLDEDQAGSNAAVLARYEDLVKQEQQ